MTVAGLNQGLEEPASRSAAAVALQNGQSLRRRNEQGIGHAIVQALRLTAERQAINGGLGLFLAAQPEQAQQPLQQGRTGFALCLVFGLPLPRVWSCGSLRSAPSRYRLPAFFASMLGRAAVRRKLEPASLGSGSNKSYRRRASIAPRQ